MSGRGAQTLRTCAEAAAAGSGGKLGQTAGQSTLSCPQAGTVTNESSPDNCLTSHGGRCAMFRPTHALQSNSRPNPVGCWQAHLDLLLDTFFWALCLIQNARAQLERKACVQAHGHDMWVRRAGQAVHQRYCWTLSWAQRCMGQVGSPANAFGVVGNSPGSALRSLREGVYIMQASQAVLRLTASTRPLATSRPQPGAAM